MWTYGMHVHLNNGPHSLEMANTARDRDDDDPADYAQVSSVGPAAGLHVVCKLLGARTAGFGERSAGM